MDALEVPKRKMALASDVTNGSISSLVVKLADGLGKLVTEHLELAKVELVADAKELGLLVARLAVRGAFDPGSVQPPGRRLGAVHRGPQGAEEEGDG